MCKKLELTQDDYKMMQFLVLLSIGYMEVASLEEIKYTLS